MNVHKYILQPYKTPSTRHHCPECGKRGVFVLYVNSDTNETLNPNVGKCERLDKCGYHYTPKQYFQDNNIIIDNKQPRAYSKPEAEKPTSYIDPEIFFKSLKGYEDNKFIQYLLTLFDADVVNQLIEKYYIGSSNHWPGSTIFYQIDTKGLIRTGKIMLYDAITGKRVKEPINHIHWVHKLIKQPEFNLKQCFFGEHLLTDNSKPIAIVESEKTAIIASVYLPQFIWIAAGNLNGLTAEKCAVLMGRSVVLYPDLNKGFEVWSAKAKELSYITKFKVSELLENVASDEERNNGLDLADYLIRYDYKEFIQPIQEPFKAPVTTPEPLKTYEAKPITKELYAEDMPALDNWNSLIDELENFFKSITLPTEPVKIDTYTTINDVLFFIDSHLSIVKAQNGNKTFKPYLKRLQKLKLCLN
jgi:hypothetical protein